MTLLLIANRIACRRAPLLEQRDQERVRRRRAELADDTLDLRVENAECAAGGRVGHAGLAREEQLADVRGAVTGLHRRDRIHYRAWPGPAPLPVIAERG